MQVPHQDFDAEQEDPQREKQHDPLPESKRDELYYRERVAHVREPARQDGRAEQDRGS